MKDIAIGFFFGWILTVLSAYIHHVCLKWFFVNMTLEKFTDYSRKNESKHGSSRKYISGCRCGLCTDWQKNHSNFRRRKEIKKQFIRRFCNEHNGEIRWLRRVALNEVHLLEEIIQFFDKPQSLKPWYAHLQIVEGLLDMKMIKTLCSQQILLEGFGFIEISEDLDGRWKLDLFPRGSENHKENLILLWVFQ